MVLVRVGIWLELRLINENTQTGAPDRGKRAVGNHRKTSFWPVIENYFLTFDVARTREVQLSQMCFVWYL